MCEVERCLKEISSNEDCEREIHVLRLEREMHVEAISAIDNACLLYTSPSPRDLSTSRMPSSA